MKHILVSVGLVAAVAAAAAFHDSASAGQKFNTTVTIAASTAYGSIGSTRNSSSTIERIGCQYLAKKVAGGYESKVTCFAANAAGTYVTCSSTAPEMLDAVRALNDDSYLSFRYVGSSPSWECTEISIYNESGDPPRLP